MFFLTEKEIKGKKTETQQIYRRMLITMAVPCTLLVHEKICYPLQLYPIVDKKEKKQNDSRQVTV